ncbi:alpha/beta hydrolase family protein [Paenibacillus qinlingensis]|uniref:alpha/beta hydrolase family protein n=1 Tax=Paenibacillus qinlingensis TaxID=1837343 RepID=UPI0015638990|nr:prolyl oligopeptidase family serine peptidase [Paenibacillus qinlingensis]NQX60131.1 prolyl oligopeptidase family serine peptidase [Paenibacillus qinlingensis]
MFEQYEDSERLTKSFLEPFRSPYQDFRYYASSVTPELRLAINIIKPESPAPILVQLHGWHMSMPQPVQREQPGQSPYLIVQVDMRGRAFSSGMADCNGLELIDIYDAVEFVRQEYGDWTVNPERVYIEGGSGGGGNVLAAVAKFPDLFAAATALYGVSDYARWYEQDLIGEFRDEMDVWIGCPPQDDPLRYAARSGLALGANLHTPLYLTHGDGDIRIPVMMSRQYVEQLTQLGKAHLVQYDELPGVGDRSHTGGATLQHLHDLQERSEANRQRHDRPIELAPIGVLLVGGYLYTKHFHVHLESVNQLATLRYDLDQQTISIFSEQRCSYRLQWSDGQTVEGECEIKSRR